MPEFRVVQVFPKTGEEDEIVYMLTAYILLAIEEENFATCRSSNQLIVGPGSGDSLIKGRFNNVRSAPLFPAQRLPGCGKPQRRNEMTSQKTDPTKAHETIIVNICEVCNRRYSLEDAQKMKMTCCGQPLTQKEERVSMPVGP